MTNIITFLINYWVDIIGVAAIIFISALNIFKYLSQNKEKQISQIKAWLLGAVTEAEKEFGGGTGRLKLASVYDKFVERFPWLAKVLSFDKFREYVDDSLIEMRQLLASNNTIAAIVNNGGK